MPKVLVIQPNGEMETKTIVTLEELQKLCGGDVQVIGFGSNADMYMDEEGKIKGYRPNHLATDWCTAKKVGLHPSDIITGTVVVMGKPDRRGVWTDVPQSVVDELTLSGE